MRPIITLILTALLNWACSGTETEQEQEASASTPVHSESPSKQSGPILGERIDGPANIRDAPNGKLLFSLEDHVQVECTELNNDWYRIGVFVQLSAKEAEHRQIPANTLLKNPQGKEIGKSLASLKPGLIDQEATGYSAFVVGFTHKDNIKTSSIVELRLAETIEALEPPVQLSDMQEVMKDFAFQSNPHEESSYFIYENILDDPSPRDRISLFFKDGELEGIVHTRPLSLSRYKTYDLIRGHRYTAIKNVEAEELKAVIDERIRFYNSID